MQRSDYSSAPGALNLGKQESEDVRGRGNHGHPALMGENIA